MSKTRKKDTPQWWIGKRVLVKQCLTVKPQHSRLALHGWLLHASAFDPDDREPCNAVGTVLDWHRGGVVAVRFSVPSLLLDGETLTTVLFAHLDDVAVTRRAFSWPLVEGSTVI